MTESADAPSNVEPYDAVLLVSFGGPEGPDDVLPFLENVTSGRGIPRERLEEVGRHYDLFGGQSPLNDLNRALVSAIDRDLAAHGIVLPVYWGNRNWDPYLRDAVQRMADDGVRRAACFVTSAYSSWSSCRQYRENLYDAVADVPDAPELDKLRPYFNHPGFVEPVVEATLESLAALPEEERAAARLVFVTHSIPKAMNDASGPGKGEYQDRARGRSGQYRQEGGAYVAQHQDVAQVVADRVAESTGIGLVHDLVYCSRSGPPHVPWLEPDVNDHLEALAATGTRAVVLVPVGFVSDHMEVVYDLDTEALATASRVGITARRAATPGTDPRFVAMVRDLLLERAAAERGEPVTRAAVGTTGPLWDRCPATCCPNPRGDRPALCAGARE